MSNSSRQIKIGAIVSYLAIAFNMVAGLIYTPWMITKIGQSNYGLYTLATSLITMFIMDFGMSAAAARFIAKYNAEGDQKSVNNIIGLIYKLYLGLDTIILTALVVVYILIDVIYTNLSPEELETFKVLYIIVGTYSVISFPFTNLKGMLTAYEQFAGLKFCELFHKVFIIIAMVLALLMGYGVYALVFVNALSGLLTIAMKLYIIKKKTPIKVNFRFFDMKMLKSFFGFSVWSTVVSLAQRLIFNITPSIIAAVSSTGSVGVAVFGLATTIESYVYTFATAINGMFMPRISKIVYSGKKDEDLLPLMTKIGRIQCMIIGILLVGFMTLGKSFVVDIWGKPDFAESYICALLIIAPSYFYLPMQIAHTTMIVENKVKLKAMIFLAVGVINVILSLILSKLYGAIGASASIFIAYTIRAIMMVTVYKKVLKLDMWSFFKGSYLKITPYLIITAIVGFLAEAFNPIANSFIRFGVNGVLVVGVFGVLMALFGMNQYEKELFFGVFKKVLKKIKR